MALPTTEIFLRSPYWVTVNQGQASGGTKQTSTVTVLTPADFTETSFYIYLNGVEHSINTTGPIDVQALTISNYINNLDDYSASWNNSNIVTITAEVEGLQSATTFDVNSATGLTVSITTVSGTNASNDNALGKVLCDLRVWTGDITDEPTYASIKLRSTALNGITSIDIAEFARDYVDIRYGSGDVSDAVFVSYELTIYNEFQDTAYPQTRVYLTGLDGYSLFQDVINYSWYKNVMMSDTDVTAYCDTSVRVPVKARLLTGYKLRSYVGPAGKFENMQTFYEVTGLGPQTSTGRLIRYVSSSYQGVYADQISFQFSEGQDELVNISYAPLSKHGFARVWFVNRLGCKQEMHLVGKSTVSVGGKSKEYKRNILVNGGYDNQRHQYHTFNKNGKISIELNTGWRNQEENDTIVEVMMSEQIWLTLDPEAMGQGFNPKGQTEFTIPVNLQSEDTKLMTRINDKLINYTFKFEAAFDLINNVR